MPITASNGFTVIRWVWFTEGLSTRPIGVVLGKNGVGEWRAFIGTGDGLDEVSDIKRVANMGATFPVEIAASLTGHPISAVMARERSA